MTEKFILSGDYITKLRISGTLYYANIDVHPMREHTVYCKMATDMYNLSNLKMKWNLHKVIIPILFIIGLTILLPFTALSQKSLKLNLQKNIENENTFTTSSLKSGQNIIHRIEVETKNGEQSMDFYYNSKNEVVRIKKSEVDLYGKEKYESEYLYSCSGTLFSCIRKIEVYDLLTGELQRTQVDGADCTLNEQGYIITEDSSEDIRSVTSYTYKDGYIQSYLYNNVLERNYTWVDGNVTMGGDNSDEYYTYSSIVSPSNLYLPQLFMQTYSEDVYYFALIGRLGKNSKNLLSQYQRYEKKCEIEYQFNGDGDITKMTELYWKNAYTIFYDDTSAPTPGNPSTGEELGDAIDDAPEGTEDNPTEIFIPSEGITLDKPLDIKKHIRLTGGTLKRDKNNPNALLRIRSGYSLELQDITIDGNQVDQKDGSLIVYGKLKLKSGVSIKNCFRAEADTPSGAICVAQDGILSMNGGTISGNTGAYGGAVYNEGTFTMAGGTISGNKSQIGVIVNNAGGKFNMTGGEISGNKVTEGCGGVFVEENCFFSMTGGEIFGNEDCAIYTWSDLNVGGSARTDGLLLLNENNRLLINQGLQNNWIISYVDVPKTGAEVAVGYNKYQLTQKDLQKIAYLNNEFQLKLIGNSIVTYTSATGNERIDKSGIQIYVSGNLVSIENMPTNSTFAIYEVSGKTVLTRRTEDNNKTIIRLEQGIYILKCKQDSYKFRVKP